MSPRLNAPTSPFSDLCYGIAPQRVQRRASKLAPSISSRSTNLKLKSGGFSRCACGGSDAEHDSECESIINEISDVFRTKNERASRLWKDRILKIIQGAKPGPPLKTTHRETTATETCKRTHPDGTVEEVTRVIERDIPADVWRQEQKNGKQKPDDPPPNALV